MFRPFRPRTPQGGLCAELATIDAPEKDKSLDQLMKEAKEKAAEKLKEFGGNRSAKFKNHEDRDL